MLTERLGTLFTAKQPPILKTNQEIGQLNSSFSLRLCLLGNANVICCQVFSPQDGNVDLFQPPTAKGMDWENPQAHCSRNITGLKKTETVLHNLGVINRLKLNGRNAKEGPEQQL